MKNKKTNKAYHSPKNENRLKNFVQKKGFYIALFTLTVILTGSAFVSSYMKNSKNVGSNFDDDAWKAAIAESENLSSAENNESVLETNSDEALDDNEITDSKPQTETEISESENVSSAATESKTTEAAVLATEEGLPDEEVQAVSAQPVSKLTLSMPCIGGIIKEYSVDELLYSETMDDWRTHNGIDISADIGTQVKAAADGVIADVYTDDLLGNVVVIDHGNGMKTLYGNLQSADYIEPNRAVKQGDIIGGVGTSSSEENADGAHLHFEFLKNDEPIKPEF